MPQHLGETQWTINGRYTGVTELELTPRGVRQVLGTGKLLVGPGKLIDPVNITRVFVSPRKRAQETLRLLIGVDDEALIDKSKVITTEDIAEWGYGDYEGLLTEEIRDRRKQKGLDNNTPWDIWRDGCEGESKISPLQRSYALDPALTVPSRSAQQVTDRLDGLIRKIYDIQRPNMHGKHQRTYFWYVLLVLSATAAVTSAVAGIALTQMRQVAHGHILRAFVKRWLLHPMEKPLSLMMAPGAVGVLSYENHQIEEPALMVGMSLPLKE